MIVDDGPGIVQKCHAIYTIHQQKEDQYLGSHSNHTARFLCSMIATPLAKEDEVLREELGMKRQ